jgi:hypothetical protein
MKGPLTSTYGGKTGPKPSPGAARRPTGEAGGAVSSSSSDATKDAVRTMQQLMSKLNTDMQTGNIAETALEKIKDANIRIAPEAYDSADEIKETVRSWGNTSAGGTAGSFDGIWGRNTKAQLENIRAFIANTKLQGMIIQEGNGDNPYRDMDDAALRKMAEDNIANLSRLFESLGMNVPNIPGTRGGNLSSFSLDRIKSELSTDDAISPNPWPDHSGNVRVTVGDMRSFVRFFQFIQNLKYKPCRALEVADRGNEEKTTKQRGKEDEDLGYADDIQTIADIILDESLIRLSTRRARGVESSEPERPTEKSGQWHCFYTVDEIFRWFASRARMVLAQVQDFIAERKPHPFYPDRLVNEQDEAAAAAYLAAANGLWEQWSKIKGDVLRQIQSRGSDAMNAPQVTLEMIMKADAGGLPTPGAARRPSDRGREETGVGIGAGGYGGGTSTISGGGSGDTHKQRALDGPVKEFIPLNWLLQGDEFRAGIAKDRLTALSKNGRLPDVHRQVWRGGNWISLAINNINGSGNTEKLRRFPQWAGLVRDVIQELYANWEADYRDKIAPQVIAQQNREMNRWGDVITSIITRAQMGMSEAVGMYGEKEKRRRR